MDLDVRKRPSNIITLFLSVLTRCKLDGSFQGFSFYVASMLSHGRHFGDDIFRCEYEFCILSKISLKFVAKVPINNNPALVEIMALRRIGGKLYEPMLTRFSDTYMQHYGEMS